VAFRFKNAACVVAGTFNIYIVQPPWLVEVGILPKETPFTIGSKLDEPGFRFSFPKLAVRWIVAPNRIMVDTDSIVEDCGTPIAKVLGALPWTPLTGLGNNTTYTASLSDLSVLNEYLRTSPGPLNGYNLTQRSFHYAATQESRIFNLQLSLTQEEIELSVNVHSELQGKEKAEGNKMACSAAGRFFQDRKDAELLIQHFFNVEIDHGNSDTKQA
jgi:hypothetical protein